MQQPRVCLSHAHPFHARVSNYPPFVCLSNHNALSLLIHSECFFSLASHCNFKLSVASFVLRCYYMK